ncbi:MAG: HAMP domain-containing histidine kinase [Caulobacteraceae bacterium]|nr:HAMP domain-containing histidine kinase [Caulobacteraceae bacterium]
MIELGGWALGTGLAAGLTGGTAGPLALWCAAPLAAALTLDNRKLVSGGAALSLVLLATSLWAAVANTAAAPPPGLSPWLSGLCALTTIGGLAWALPLSMRRRADRAERAEEAQARLEALLAGQPHLVITVDAVGKLGSAFGAAPAGVPVDALFSHGLVAAAWHPDRANVQTAILRAATRGEAETGFAPRAAPDRWVELSLRRLPDGRLAGVISDGTIRHSREMALETARAEAESLNASKSRFLANMSHELRTPLNAVIGFSDIMKQRLFGPMPDKYLEYARLIHESGGHLLALINDVLDMSKIEAERYELSRTVFDAREPVSAALRLVRLQAHEAAVALRSVLPPEPATVEADERAIKQITLNLLSNALKFTPAGGSVTVTVGAGDGVLEIAVSDTGVGIAPEDLDRLGRPYEQAGDATGRAKGTGLGLSLVRAFAELHGGSMAIESQQGEGTAVTVRLPVLLNTAVEGRPQGAEIIPLNVGR